MHVLARFALPEGSSYGRESLALNHLRPFSGRWLPKMGVEMYC